MIIGAPRTFKIPYVPPAEYNLKVTFSVDFRSFYDVNLVLTQGDIQFSWKTKTDKKTDTLSGFSVVAGRRLHENTTVVRSLPALISGQKHTVLIEVRKDRVSAYRDGKPAGQLRTNFKNLSVYAPWALRGKHIGIGGHGGVVRVHSMVLEAVGR